VHKHDEGSLYGTLALTITMAIKENKGIVVKYISSEHYNLIGAETSRRVTPNGVILANQVGCQGP